MKRIFKPPWPKISVEKQAWRSQFLSLDKLVIELGAGVGRHAIMRAKQYPDEAVVALERTQEKSAKLLKRVAHHPHLSNIHADRCDAVQWIWQNILPNEVDHYFILYPNPQPKNKQANLRWVNMPFFGYMKETMRPGGLITITTNMQWYHDEACEQALNRWSLKCISNRVISADAESRTHFERKYLARGDLCFESVHQV